MQMGRIAKALLLVGALLACGVPVALIAHPVSYVPLLTVLIVVALSFAYLQVLKRTFSYDESQMADSCERGQDVGLSVTVTNRSMLPHPRVEVALYISDLFGEYGALHTMTVPLGPRETTTFDFDARFAHLGRYTAGVDHVTLFDLLGLFSARIDNATRRRVIVRPRLFDLVDVDVSNADEQAEVSMLKPVTSDNADYASVREYRYGDPLKTVHWSLSARSADGTLYTRLYETYVNPSLAIVIDPFAESGDPEELMSLFDGVVESAASLSHFARSQGVECTIRYLDRNLDPASACLASSSDADELVLDAHRITPLSESGMRAAIPIDMLRAEGIGQQGASNVAFATARLSEDIVAAIVEIAGQRRNPILLLTVPARLVGRERAAYLAPLSRLAQMGIPYFVFESTELETRRASA